MSNQLVSEADVEKALDWLRDSADEIGEAKREAVKTEHMMRHVKALAMKQHMGLPLSAQEREAYASDQYLTAIDRAANAAGEYEKLKSLRGAAEMKIEAWRSMGANYRAMKL